MLVSSCEEKHRDRGVSAESSCRVFGHAFSRKVRSGRVQAKITPIFDAVFAACRRDGARIDF